MTPDDRSDHAPPMSPGNALVRPASPVPRFLLLAGVAGACVLGVAAGLWARPQAGERRGTHAVAAAPAPAAPEVPRQLQIVVDDAPAPAGTPLQVLPDAHSSDTGGSPAASPLAPVARVAAGLMRVDAREPAPAPAPAAVAAPPQVQAPPPQPVRLVAKPPPVVAPQRIAQADVQAQAQAQARAAAKAAAADQRRQQTILAARAAAQRETQRLAEAARAAKTKAVLLARAEAASLKARAEKIRLAQAKAQKAQAAAQLARREQAAREELQARREDARREQLARLEARQDAHRAKAVQLAQAEARERARQAEQQKAIHLAEVRKAEMARLARARGGGLLKLAKASRCVSPDPGAALVCANPNLGAADRRMNEAYAQAEAAGVPAWRLQSQHQRWLAARSAAAREAPWAVQDVYQERIAELRDQARNPDGE